MTDQFYCLSRSRKKGGWLGQERVLQTLVGLGLTPLDSQVYLYLSKKGLQKGGEISDSLKMNKQQTYRSLKSLQGKGIVTATLEHPARFSAVSFEKLLDLFIKAKMDETQRLQQNKDEILAEWQTVTIEENCNATPKFAVIKGRNYIYPKIQQMIQETKKRFSAITTAAGLIQANQFGLFDAGFKHPLKSEIQARFLTILSEENMTPMKTLFREMTRSKLNFEVRTPYSGLKLFPRMVIRDEEEIMFFITSKTSTAMVEQDDLCLWTNCKALVQTLIGVFEEIWRNATDIKKRIAEIETGKQTIISNSQSP